MVHKEYQSHNSLSIICLEHPRDQLNSRCKILADMIRPTINSDLLNHKTLLNGILEIN